jgi:FkbM family methyltransferase
VLDIGANYGEYTWLLARLVGPKGRVYAFEPYPETAHALAWGTRIFGLKHVSVVPQAVGLRTGTVRLGLPISESTHGLIHGQIHVDPNSEGTGPCVPVTSIDAFCQRQAVDQVALIKIDVEGYELNVLKGASHTIAECNPWIICEIEERWCSRYGFSADSVFRCISELAPYDTYVTDAHYDLVPVPGLVVGRNNYVFGPREGQFPLER